MSTADTSLSGKQVIANSKKLIMLRQITSSSVLAPLLVPLIGRLNYDRLRALKTLGYIPHIKHPRTFNEKLLHRKFFQPIPNCQLFADKWLVRDFVKDKVGEHVLNEVFCVARHTDSIDFDELPNSFVIRMNNASNRTILVSEKNTADIPGIKARLEHWLHLPFGYETNETFYAKIEPLIIVEKFIGNSSNVPHDFKVHVFHGKAKYIEVHTDRFTEHKERFYDTDWNPQSFTQGKNPHTIISRPCNLESLIEVAESLGESFDYVRVDLYITGEQVVFGEMTFTPESGHSGFEPKDVDFYFGSLW